MAPGIPALFFGAAGNFCGALRCGAAKNSMSAYIVLFWTALGSATILPFYSEFLLIALFERGLDPFWLWFAATTGNTLGALVNLSLIHI